MSDDIRQGALNLINQIRSQVALGQFRAMNPMPSASDMSKLAWDCNLENIAQRVIHDCPAPPKSARNAINYV
ncbi:hypothetical protein KIN20_038220 [Parelaphostrongylus tenuis]|uniref:SCP domain-containing protein n=1 Tax=Parelaphostrongylus tenuis TaxID=148309 RepID=A0AAD5RIM6_PARTN|nr:hypothetical protein KIN20_038220 [Parelaphostrongylus tenuis]